LQSQVVEFVSRDQLDAQINENEDEKDRTILTQKSMTYFKNLGIEDEDVIYRIIKRELFFKKFSSHEKNNTAEDFIKSEIAKEIEIIKLHKSALEKEIAIQKESAEKLLKKEKKEIEKYKTEKENIVKEKQSEIDILLMKIKEKNSLDEDKSLYEKAVNNIESKKIFLEKLKKDHDHLNNQIKEIEIKENELEIIKPKLSKLNVLKKLKASLDNLKTLQINKKQLNNVLTKIDEYKTILDENKNYYIEYSNLSDKIFSSSAIKTSDIC